MALFIRRRTNRKEKIILKALCFMRQADLRAGGMAEWLKAAVLKTASRKSGRGFESYSLRHVTLIRDA